MVKNRMYWKTFGSYAKICRRNPISRKYECPCDEWNWMTYNQIQKHFYKKHILIESECKGILKEVTRDIFTGWICEINDEVQKTLN